MLTLSLLVLAIGIGEDAPSCDLSQYVTRHCSYLDDGESRCSDLRYQNIVRDRLSCIRLASKTSQARLMARRHLTDDGLSLEVMIGLCLLVAAFYTALFWCCLTTVQQVIGMDRNQEPERPFHGYLMPHVPYCLLLLFCSAAGALLYYQWLEMRVLQEPSLECFLVCALTIPLALHIVFYWSVAAETLCLVTDRRMTDKRELR